MNSGDTAWLLASASMVLLMTPGLAFFYGGMVRQKSVLNMIMMSFGALGLVGVLWVIYGYSEAFGDDLGAGVLGDPFQYFGLKGLMSPKELVGTIPATTFVGFQAVFAIITVALISGAIADRAKFGAWMVFAGIWATVVYFPVAHWVFAFDDVSTAKDAGGWVANNLKAIDFAGGTAVHINAGAAGLACALVLGKRIGFAKDPMRGHNIPFVMLGAGLLWFGWFGFNAGSAVSAGTNAGVAWINTMVATSAAMLGWMVLEKIRGGHSTALGAASGAVAGLVAITPSCGAVNPIGAIILGFIAGVLCAWAVGMKYALGFDDSLDVVGVHLFGGLWGTLAVGLLATSNAPNGVDGLFFGGGVDQLWRQAVAAGAVLVFSFVVTYVLATIVDKTMGFRISEDDESEGIDVTTHSESAYDFGTAGGGVRTLAGTSTVTKPASEGANA